MKNKKILYFHRKKAKGPPHKLEKYGLISYKKSLFTLQEALHSNKISYGLHDLMRGLLTQGSITDYPAGEGIDYKYLIKNTLDSNTVKNSLIELSNQIPENVDIIFGIQNSGVALANVIGFHMRKRVETIFKTTKENYKNNVDFGVLIDSYTKGEKNVLSIEPDFFNRYLKNNNHRTLRIAFVDDICDTGTLLCAVTALLKNASQQLHVKLKIVKLLTLFERIHTQARKKLKKEIGMGLISVAKIEDMGQKPYSWVKIKGIKQALSFENQ